MGAQGGGGVIIPGGLQGNTEPGTCCHGLGDMVVFTHGLDLISEVFSSLIDAVILHVICPFCSCVVSGKGLLE